jgi:hypothetical protein
MNASLLAIAAGRETVDWAQGAVAASGERVIYSPVAITVFGATTHLIAGGGDLIRRDHSPLRRWR